MQPCEAAPLEKLLRAVAEFNRRDWFECHETLEDLWVGAKGELRYFYEIADVVFVGKSLTAEGGQNPIEPGAIAKPIVFGPNMQNFEAISKLLVSRRGAVQVPDADALEKAFAEWLANPQQAAEFGRNAQTVVRENLGAIDRTVEMILETVTR